ncbi:hypothetical protein RFM98_05275 [Mesorhizobium sp. VK9D]|uniref:hypothetical protein n=1 Tax=Mesorhizobium australafricanum TaxID=3072311 RepID=UPI002A2452A4|nr:hypothetical protein [Mesorhizobium sp. VK9D]MDX8452160.1 hypothetical protein [Mesorhizobium sp. VK9D]
MPVLAENAPGLELKLDIDQDGKTDRAVVIQEAGGPADLYIYLDEEQPDPARQPNFVRKGLTEDRIHRPRKQGQGIAGGHFLLRLRRQQVDGRDADDRQSPRQVSDRRL